MNIETMHLVVIGCDDPSSARFLSEANGTNKVYRRLSDAQDDAKKANDNGYKARVICI